MAKCPFSLPRQEGCPGETHHPLALLGWLGTSDLGGQPAAPATGRRGPGSAGWAPGFQGPLTGLHGFRAGPGGRPCRQVHCGEAQEMLSGQEPHFLSVPASLVSREDTGEGQLCAQWWLCPSMGSGTLSNTQGRGITGGLAGEGQSSRRPRGPQPGQHQREDRNGRCWKRVGTTPVDASMACWHFREGTG